MADVPDVHRDFAAWTAYNWSRLVPDADPTAAAVAIRFIRAADELAHSHATTIRPWRKTGITSIADFRILGLLRHRDGEGIRTQHIAEHLHFEPATVSSRLARLEKHGHVQRIDHPTNRRSHLVILNPDSAQLVDDIYQALVDNHTRFFATLTDGEHDQLANMLGRLTNS